MNAPESIQNLVAHANGWSEPQFVSFERGLFTYKTITSSNAGGCEHTIYFPVNAGARAMNAQEKWEKLADDATQAVKNGTIKKRIFVA